MELVIFIMIIIYFLFVQVKLHHKEFALQIFPKEVCQMQKHQLSHQSIFSKIIKVPYN